MSGPLEPHSENLRISDADRHAVSEALRDAAAEGRIDLEELEERLEQTYAAKTYGDLVPITADLPGAGTVNVPVVRPGNAPRQRATGLEPSYSSSFSMMGEVTRKGVWLMPETHNVVAIMAGATIDLREAVFAEPEVVINATSIMAGIDIYVNAHTRVIVEGVGLMGDFSEARDKVPAELSVDSPIVRVKGMALMGAVTVQRRPMPGEKKQRRLKPR